MTITKRLMEKYYSTQNYDGTTIFYNWIREHANPSDHVLNMGAGPATRHPTRCLKGEVAEVVGADVDSEVLNNEELDRAFLLDDGRVAVPDNHFDLAFSDYVLEHVEDPIRFLGEIRRVLKPGGSFFFRTPNVYHYVALISKFTPHSVHLLVANRVRNMSQELHDPWPTFYRMNTRRRILELAKIVGFASAELRMIECEPSYMQFHPAPFLLGMMYERAVNSTDLLAGWRANILGRLVKGH